MTDVNEFRFATNVFALESAGAFAGRCRRIEALGYDTLFAADHLGVAAPFPTLVAAAQATERLRVGTLVLNAPFWNSELLARDVATTDVLTGGRLELGLGAGHMKWEFDEAGIGWEPIGRRVDRLEALIDGLGRRFAEGGYPQHAELRAGMGLAPLQPVQRRGFGGTGPPLLIGGTGDRVLQLAAERADIVGVAGAVQVPGQAPGVLRIATATEADERVRFARERAGARADRLEWQVLVQAVVVTDDREGAARALLERYGPMMSVEELLDTPFALIGTVERMADQVLRNRDRYGFTYYTVHGPYLEAFAPALERVRMLGG